MPLVINCEFLKDTTCLKASAMAGTHALTSEQACKVCLEQSSRENHVTASLALRVMLGPPTDRHQYLYTLVKHETIKQVIKEPVGTALKNLISWFVWSKKARNCLTCKNREITMNLWGADKCKRNIEIIVGWLKESAHEHNLPFSERIARAFIRKAIKNSRS